MDDQTPKNPTTPDPIANDELVPFPTPSAVSPLQANIATPINETPRITPTYKTPIPVVQKLAQRSASPILAATPSRAETPMGTEKNPIVVKPERPYERAVATVTWQGHARVFKNRQPVWFVGVLALSLVVAILLIISQQWTLLLAIAAFVVTLILINVIEPQTQNYAISPYGVKVGSKENKYNDLKWFWFEEEPYMTTLFISTYLQLPQVLEIPLPPNPTKELKEQIEDELLKYLPYHEEGERNWLNSIDTVVAQIEPYIPKKVIDVYINVIHKRLASNKKVN